MPNIGEIVQTLQQYEEALSRLSDNLRWLQLEVRLQQNGYKIYYAVDFAEVFSYAHPFVSSILWEASHEEARTERERLIRRQIALSFLFNDPRFKGKLILLEPYLAELYDHIWRIRKNLVRDFVEVARNIKAHFEREAEKTLPVKNLLKVLEEGGDIPPGEMEQFAVYIERNLKELVSLFLMGEERDLERGNKAIASIIEKKQLVEMREVWQELQDRFERMDLDSAPWLKMLTRQRPAKADYYANLFDAQAAAIVRTANPVLLDNKEILLFLTHANTLHRAFRDSLVCTILFENQLIQLNLLRRPDYLVTYISTIKESWEATLANIERKRNLIHAYNKLIPQLKEFANRTGQSSDFEDLEPDLYQGTYRLLDEIPRCINSLENLETATNEHTFLRYLKDYIQLAQQAPDQAQGTVQRILRILQSDPRAKEALRQQSSAVFSQLLADRITLQSVVQLPTTGIEKLLQHQTTVQEGVDKPLLIRLGGEKFRYELKFRNTKLKHYAVLFFEAVDSAAAHKTKESILVLQKSFDQLLLLKLKEDIPAEVHLLFAFIYAMIDDFAAAIDEIEQGLSKDESVYELWFLKAVVLRIQASRITAGSRNPETRRIQKLQEAALACDKTISIQPTEAKSYKEKSLIVHRLMELQLAPTTKSSDGVDILVLDQAIALLEKAESLTKPNEESLQMQIMNNLAFYYAQRNRPGDLEKANEYIIKLEALTNSNLEPESVAVRGFVNYELAKQRIYSSTHTAYTQQDINQLKGAIDDLRNAEPYILRDQAKQNVMRERLKAEALLSHVEDIMRRKQS